jgi:hypothetical protein
MTNGSWRESARAVASRSVILFALGGIALFYVELWLVARLPNSTVADYVALANDLTPVLREGMRDGEGFQAADKRG